MWGALEMHAADGPRPREEQQQHWPRSRVNFVGN
jgi:hypothetical protein